MARAFATAAALAERESVQDMVEAAAREDRTVTATMLQAAIDGDLSAFTPAEQASARKALDRLERAIDDANAEVEGYLTRYPDIETPGALAVYALDIAAWRLLGGGNDTERYQRYRAAVRYLADVAAGRVDLAGAGEDASASAAAAGIGIHEGSKTFTDKSLAGYVDPRLEQGL